MPDWTERLTEEERTNCYRFSEFRGLLRTIANLRALVEEKRRGLLAATDALDGVVKWNEEVDGFALPDGVSEGAYFGLDKGNAALALTEADMRERLEGKC